MCSRAAEACAPSGEQTEAVTTQRERFFGNAPEVAEQNEIILRNGIGMLNKSTQKGLRTLRSGQTSRDAAPVPFGEQVTSPGSKRITLRRASGAARRAAFLSGKAAASRYRADRHWVLLRRSTVAFVIRQAESTVFGQLAGRCPLSLRRGWATPTAR